MVDIDSMRLELAIKNSMAEEFWEKINFEKLINNCEIINDATAILIKYPSFYFIFDIETYELIDGKGDDTIISKDELEEMDPCQ